MKPRHPAIERALTVMRDRLAFIEAHPDYKAGVVCTAIEAHELRAAIAKVTA